MDKRIRAWAEATNRLPRSQNGFRPGFRTNNNAFILRCAAERAAAAGKKLYVASVDLANAFPSVDRPLLWIKLQRMGMQGPLLDLYRHIYASMTYIIRSGGMYSDPFNSDIGVLIGDPASPIMWNLFFADFLLPPHADDIRLAGQLLAHLEHADDVIIFSTSPEGLQAHLKALSDWAALSFVTVNVDKTWALLTGGATAHDIFLHLDKRKVSFTKNAKYVGMHITSTNARIFRSHYSEQAKKARLAAGLVYAVEGLTGALRADMVKTVYMGRVDPHLISGADVCPDAVDSHVQELEEIQVLFLRRMLGLGTRSMITPLFSETGLWPIRLRRVELALEYLKYCLTRRDDELVACALQDSLALAQLHCLSWYGDLQAAVEFFGATLPPAAALTVDAVDRAADLARRTLLGRVNAEFQTSPKLWLLRGTTTSGKVGRAGVTMLLREYLFISKKPLRRALNNFLLSDHNLAIEVLRYSTRSAPPIPRERRLCRFCQDAVEDEIHAAFICNGDAGLVLARERFWYEVWRKGWFELFDNTITSSGYIALIQLILLDRKMATCFAKLVRDALATFDTTPVLRM